MTRRDLSEWDVVQQSWVLQQGSYGVLVGSSSRDLPLSGTLTIGSNGSGSGSGKSGGSGKDD